MNEFYLTDVETFPHIKLITLQYSDQNFLNVVFSSLHIIMHCTLGP